MIHNCITEMLRHWPPSAISKRSSWFMYKGKLSLYTLNTVTSHDTCNGLRKSCWMVNAIRYRRSTSGSSLSTSFVGPLAPCLSYTVNKHKWMIVNTLFVTNPFLRILKNNKMKYMFWKRLYKICRPSKKGVKCLAQWLSLLNGYKNMCISISNFLNTDLHLIIAQRKAVDGHRPFINSSKGNQSRRILIDIQPTFLWVTSV